MLRRRFMQLLGISLVSPLFTRKAIAQTPARKIQLQEVFVAGYQYHEGMNQLVEASLAVGQKLCLVREANNQYDCNAIAVVTLDGHKLGYIPRDVNVIPAAMADQKVTICAVVSKISPAASTWERLAISSYMKV
jgi:GTP cyclohydrolase I